MFVLLSAFLVAGFVQAPRDEVAEKNNRAILKTANVVEDKISDKNKTLLAAKNRTHRSSVPMMSGAGGSSLAAAGGLEGGQARSDRRERERGRRRGLHGVRFSPIRSSLALSSRSRR